MKHIDSKDYNFAEQVTWLEQMSECEDKRYQDIWEGADEKIAHALNNGRKLNRALNMLEEHQDFFRTGQTEMRKLQDAASRAKNHLRTQFIKVIGSPIRTDEDTYIQDGVSRIFEAKSNLLLKLEVVTNEFMIDQILLLMTLGSRNVVLGIEADQLGLDMGEELQRRIKLLEGDQFIKTREIVSNFAALWTRNYELSEVWKVFPKIDNLSDTIFSTKSLNIIKHITSNYDSECSSETDELNKAIHKYVQRVFSHLVPREFLLSVSYQIIHGQNNNKTFKKYAKVVENYAVKLLEKHPHTYLKSSIIFLLEDAFMNSSNSDSSKVLAAVVGTLRKAGTQESYLQSLEEIIIRHEAKKAVDGAIAPAEIQEIKPKPIEERKEPEEIKVEESNSIIRPTKTSNLSEVDKKAIEYAEHILYMLKDVKSSILTNNNSVIFQNVKLLRSIDKDPKATVKLSSKIKKSIEFIKSGRSEFLAPDIESLLYSKPGNWIIEQEVKDKHYTFKIGKKVYSTSQKYSVQNKEYPLMVQFKQNFYVGVDQDDLVELDYITQEQILRSLSSEGKNSIKITPHCVKLKTDSDLRPCGIEIDKFLKVEGQDIRVCVLKNMYDHKDIKNLYSYSIYETEHSSENCIDLGMLGNESNIQGTESI